MTISTTVHCRCRRRRSLPACPTCANRPADARELQLHREGLETVWLLHDPDQPGRLVERAPEELVLREPRRLRARQ